MYHCGMELLSRKCCVNYFKVFCFCVTKKLTVTNTNDIREGIKRRTNMGNACYYSLEKILSSRLLSKKLEVKTYQTIILPVVLCGCKKAFFCMVMYPSVV